MTKKQQQTISGVDLSGTAGKPPDKEPTEEKTKEETQAMGIRIPTALVEEVDTIAAQYNVSRSALVRWVLSNFVDDYKAGRVEIPTRTVTTIADI